MDEILNQVLEACRLTRELETNLPHIANNPRFLLDSCEEIFLAFSKAVFDLRGSLAASSSSLIDPAAGQLIIGGGPMDLLSQRRLIEDATHLYVPDSMPTDQVLPFSYLPTSTIEPAREFVAVGGAEQHLALMAESGGTLGGPLLSTGQRTSRRRRDSGETRTVRIPALRTGNLELPPDDGYTWRKYGQKVILGSRFPRSYFRCTHKNFYGCKAKRKVQRLDADPNTYEITYCGNHTCHTSPTPLILPSITPTTNESVIGNITGMTGASPSPAVSLSTSIELSIRPFISSHVGESSRARDEGPSELQPQPVRTAREGEGSVAELADAMFNSGSSSNSMDTFFTFRPDE